MHRSNMAIKRVRPTTDNILSAENGNAVLSKLDLNEGYHLLKLDNSSR